MCLGSVLVNLSAELSNNLGIPAFVPNSRGVGNSTGRSSFSGQSEASDLEELVKWCIDRVGNVGTVLLVVGSSSWRSLVYHSQIVARGILTGLCSRCVTPSCLHRYERTTCYCHTHYPLFLCSRSSMLRPTETNSASSWMTLRPMCSFFTGIKISLPRLRSIRYGSLVSSRRRTQEQTLLERAGWRPR